MRGLLRFYGRVLRRVPKVFTDTAGRITLATAVAAAIILVVFSNKKLAAEVLAFQGYSPIIAIIPIALLLAYGLAQANYQEALLLAPATNRTDPAPPGITVNGDVHIHVSGTNSALSLDELRALTSGTQTETERER